MQEVKQVWFEVSKYNEPLQLKQFVFAPPLQVVHVESHSKHYLPLVVL